MKFKLTGKEKWTAPGVILLTLLVIVALNYHANSSPDGVYYDEGLAEGGGYWIFKNGNLFIIGSETTNFVGTYSKVGNDWIGHGTDTNYYSVLVPSLVGIKMVFPPNRTNKSYNIYLPRRYFSWLHELAGHH